MDLGKYIVRLLPMEMELPAIPNPFTMSPMYTAVAIILMFASVPALVALWGLFKQWTSKRVKKFHFFMLPIDNDKKTPFVIRVGTTLLKSQLLDEWLQPEKTTKVETVANISKILKQKTRQLLTEGELSESQGDKCRIFNCTLRSLTGKSKQMIVMGCVERIEGPLSGDVFMKHAVPKGSSSQERIRACSDETQESLQVISEPAKYSKYQYCFMCSKKNVVPHGTAHFFIDDIFSNNNDNDEPETPPPPLQNPRISVCIPICSEECLKVSMQALFETKPHKKQIIKEEEEEEKKEEEDT